MTRTHRILAVAIGVALLANGFLVLQRGDEPEPRAETVTAAAAPFSTQPDTKTMKREPEILLQPGTVKTIAVQKGDTVRFSAKSMTPDEIHVHGYDLSKEAPAGKRVSMNFEANIEGIFEIEFEQAGVPIASLKVEPR